LTAALAVLAALLALGASVAGAAFSKAVFLSEDGQDADLPDVASDADGDAVAVWQRFNGSIWRIEARTISAAGARGPIRTLSGSGQEALRPQVATDTAGGGIAVWHSLPAGSYQRVQARTISPSGVLGTRKNLTPVGDDASRPQIASDADGDAIAIWQLWDGSHSRIQARTISSAGLLGPRHDLSAAGRDAFDPQIASDADGDAIAVWRRFDGGEHRVQARTISAAGVLGPVRHLSAAGPPPTNIFGSTDPPQVATDADGDAVAVWTVWDGANDRVQARTISAAGALGPIQDLSAAGEDAYEPAVTSDPDGDAVAAWGRHTRVQARTISATGVPGPVLGLSDECNSCGTTNRGQQPQVASDADGDAVAIWMQRQRIEARTISAVGVLGQIQTLSSGAIFPRPQVASDADGDAVAVWQSRVETRRIRMARGP
jgi:hypothetical protein